MKATKKIVLAHVPYLSRGGEDIHVEGLSRLYESLDYGIHFAPLLREAPGFSLKQAIRSLSLNWRENDHCLYLDELWKKGEVSLVHQHNIFPSLGPSFLSWVIERRIPLLATIHNHRFFCTNGLALRSGEICRECFLRPHFLKPIGYNCNDSLPKSTYYSAALKIIRDEKLLERATSRWIAPSPYILNELIRYGFDQKKIALIFNPIEKGHTSGVQKKWDFFYAGRLSQEKGVNELIQAAILMPKHQFALAGEGPLRPMLEETVRMHGSKNIRLLGHLTSERVQQELAQSHVCVLPSLCNEILPTFVIEALISGKRLVVSNQESTQWFTQSPFWAIGCDPRNMEGFRTVLEDSIHALEPTEEQIRVVTEMFCKESFLAKMQREIEALLLPNTSL